MGSARLVETRADADLVALARGGDKDAFAELASRHWDTACGLAGRVLQDAHLARDACQEATVVALVGLDRLRAPERFGPWLCGITLNVARRWLRDSMRAEPASDELIDIEPGPHESAEAAFLAERVRGAIARLAPGQREAVLLFYLQGLSHREVAAELGISIGAVKARLHQARAALAPRLAAEIEEEPTMADATTTIPEWVDVSIAEVRAGGDDHAARRQYVVVLHEQHGDRRLPIWIGPSEAIALALTLGSQEMPRPMTYQFGATLLQAAGGSVVEVRVTQLLRGVFYGVVVVEGPQGRREVDARPSDALNLAAVAGAPIKVDANVLADTSAVGRTEWMGYETSTDNLVAEVLEAQEEAMTRLRAAQEGD